MNEKIREQGKQFADFLNGLPDVERIAGNDAEFQNAKTEHQEFKVNYSRGKCYLCGRFFKSFQKKNPCIHWLMNPKGFRKNDIPRIAQQYGF